MNYCIMTLDKIKTHGALVSRFHHDYRIANVKNAYPEKLDENKYLIFQKNEQGEIQDYSQSWHERIDGIPYYQERMESQKRQVRSNAVLAYDIVLAYTPESNIDTDEWCKANVQWLEDTFNVAPDNKSNLLAVTYHGDEASPHIHAIVIPIDPEGRLNAAYFTNGSRRISDLQTSYALDMERFGLSRGVVHSHVQHRTSRQYNIGLEQAFQNIPKPIEHESAKDYYERATTYLHDYVEIAYKEQNRKMTRSIQQIDMHSQNLQEKLQQEKDSLLSFKAEMESDIHNLMEQREHLKREIEQINGQIEEKINQKETIDREEISH